MVGFSALLRGAAFRFSDVRGTNLLLACMYVDLINGGFINLHIFGVTSPKFHPFKYLLRRYSTFRRHTVLGTFGHRLKYGFP